MEPGFYDTRSNDILDFTITFFSPDKSTVKCMKKDLDQTIFDATISSFLRCKFILPSVNLTSIQHNWLSLSTKVNKYKTTHVQHSTVQTFFKIFFFIYLITWQILIVFDLLDLLVCNKFFQLVNFRWFFVLKFICDLNLTFIPAYTYIYIETYRKSSMPSYFRAFRKEASLLCYRKPV